MGLIKKLTPGVTYQQKFLPDLEWDSQHQGTKKLVLKCLQNIVWISYHAEGLWNGIFTAITVNKDVTVIRDSGPPNVNFWAQEEQCLLSFTHQAAAPVFSQLPLSMVGKELSTWIIKLQDVAPDSWNAHEKKKKKVSLSLDAYIFPYIKKH